MRDYYADLGVRRDATQGAVKKAYEKKAKRLARLPDEKRLPQEAVLKEAFGVLSNPDKRAQFDSRLMELDANLGGTGSNAPLVVGILVVLFTVVGVGGFLYVHSRDRERMEVQERTKAEQAQKPPAQPAATPKAPPR